MTDRRVTPDLTVASGREPCQIVLSCVDLLRAPQGARDRQVLLGETVAVLGEKGGWRYVQAEKDGYCGYVAASALGPVTAPTHRVSAPASHAYIAPDIKSADRFWLSHGSLLTALSSDERFIETAQGYVPIQHLHPAQIPETDPAEVALRFLGTPYLWGGNSALGIDCSGLVQAALIACGIPCPGDSDMQQDQLGTALPEGTPPRRNDLIFWKGHVALVVDDTTLIHANAAHMAVALEPTADAIARIEAQGDGRPTAHKRLPLPSD